MATGTARPRQLVARAATAVTRRMRAFEPRRHLLEARDPVSAARLMINLVFALAGLTFGYALLSLLVDGDSPGWFLVVPIGIAALGATLRRHPPAARSPVWIGVPLLGSAIIATLNVSTSDASASAQVFLFIPVLFAASHLHAPGAGLVAIFTAVCAAVSTFLILPFSAALMDTVFVSALLLSVSAVIVRAGRRRDELVARLREQATIDPLTGLVTRRAFDERAEAALQRRTTGAGTALILIDVDRFKAINDTYGHLVGDDALTHVARLLAAHTRVDSVISRVGGDEIAVLLPRCGYRAACDRANDFVSLVRRTPLTIADSDDTVDLTVSVGVAHAPEDGGTLRELYNAADVALYRAKRAGRDQVGLIRDLPDSGTSA